MRPRRDGASVLAPFAAFGVFWGAWGAALPQIQRAAHVGSGTLGLDLLLTGIGAIFSMRVAGGLADRLGRLVLPGSMIGLAVAGVLPALAHSGVALGVALIVVGAASGAFDVAINTASARSEATTGRPIMNLAHASFSIGVVVTSLSVGLALDHGATPFEVFAICGAATTLVALVLNALGRTRAESRPGALQGARAPAAAPAEESSVGNADRRRFAIPLPLLILGGICGLAYFVEGAWQSWGAIHIERTFGGSPALGAAAPAAFALAAATGRLVGQRFSARVTPRSLLRRGALLATAGTVLAAAAPNAWDALLGVAAAGLGTSVCAPTVFSLTGQVAGPVRRGAAMGTVTTIAYLGFVLGPALVGVFTSAIGLRAALAVVAVAAVALGLLAGRAPVPRDHVEAPSKPRPTT